MMTLVRRIACALGIAGALIAGSAMASVTISGTRIVYPLENREVTVKLQNDRTDPALVQVWMDEGNASAKPEEGGAPFVLTPPIFRMDGSKSQTLRMMYTGDALPQDRESVFWLNVLDVPPKAKESPDVNTLQFAFRTRIKVFARPKGLAGSPEQAAKDLAWKIVPSEDKKGYAVSATNSSAYHVSFSEIDVVSGSQTYKNEFGGMVKPKSTAVFPIKGLTAVPAGARVKYIAIGDYGGALPNEAMLAE
jgi:chaperone protein EcpD